VTNTGTDVFAAGAPPLAVSDVDETNVVASAALSSLRNIALTAPYFHTGRSWDPRQAVSVMGVSQLGATLNAEETDRIVAFLESLTGEQPKIVYPILPPSVASTPRPKP